MGKIIDKIFRETKSFFISFRCKRADKKIFHQEYKEARAHYLEKIKTYDFSEFIMPKWQSNMSEMEKYFINDFSFGFLNNRVIKSTMFMYTSGVWKKTQLDFIKSFFGIEKAQKNLRENSIGRPLLNDGRFATSGNTIHHLYHLAKFFKETGTQPEDFDNILEVGGGYGNMARLFKQLNAKATYTILDLPVFSYIQLVYLRTLLGNDAVNLIEKNNTEIKLGKINIFPIDKELLEKLGQNMRCNLFASTWALSESNKKMHETIRALGYFKSKYVLLAYQKNNSHFSYAESVKNIGDDYKITYNKEIEFIPENYYLFALKR
jgi:hypothetical protein